MPENKNKEPFLHIQQPGIQVPVRHMQEVYRSRKAEKKKEEKRDLLNVNKVEEVSTEKDSKLKNAEEENLERQNELVVNELKEESEPIDSEKEKRKQLSPFLQYREKKAGSSFQRLRSFKEMNILERVEYLVEFPKQLTPVTCIFETEDNSIRGILKGKTEENIEVRKNDGNVVSIEIKSLKDIRMLGMRK